MEIKKALLVLFTPLLIFSCKKEAIEDPLPSGNPVFELSGTFGASAFLYRAGDDGVIMEPAQDISKGVSFYYGKFTDGDDFFQLGMYDGNVEMVSHSFLTDLPENLAFAYFNGEPVATLSKEMFANREIIETVKWYVDGQFFGEDEAHISEPGKYEVCAEVWFEDGHQSTLCNELLLGFEHHARVYLRHFLAPNGSFQAWLDAPTVPIQEVKWFINGELFTQEEKLTTTLSKGTYTITAEIRFQNGVIKTQRMLVDGCLNGHFIEDLTGFEQLTSQDSWDYKALISVRKNGQDYVSAAVQNESSTFEIDDVSFYRLDEHGNAIYKIMAEINCKLKNIQTGEIVDLQTKGAFAIRITP
jgi:hypothetical protein